MTFCQTGQKAKDVFLAPPWELLMVLYWQDPKALLNFLVRFLFFVLSERSTTFFVVIVFYVQIGRYPIISVCWNFYEFL